VELGTYLLAAVFRVKQANIDPPIAMLDCPNE
jgi:hypothetical protein